MESVQSEDRGEKWLTVAGRFHLAVVLVGGLAGLCGIVSKLAGASAPAAWGFAGLFLSTAYLLAFQAVVGLLRVRDRTRSWWSRSLHAVLAVGLLGYGVPATCWQAWKTVAPCLPWR
jgi:uncharacterized membrane protein YhaH (DUF805 family)